jgi:hypothetical protein
VAGMAGGEENFKRGSEYSIRIFIFTGFRHLTKNKKIGCYKNFAISLES